MKTARVLFSLMAIGFFTTSCGIKGKPLPPVEATPQVMVDPEPEVAETPKIDPAAGKKQDSKTKKKKKTNGN